MEGKKMGIPYLPKKYQCCCIFGENICVGGEILSKRESLLGEQFWREKRKNPIEEEVKYVF